MNRVKKESCKNPNFCAAETDLLVDFGLQNSWTKVDAFATVVTTVERK